MPAGGADIAAKLRRMARNLKDSLRRAERDNARDALRLAKIYSRGQLTAADLRRLGHPYRKGGTPPADPALINRRTGLFARSWRVEGGNESAAGDLILRLSNSAPYAQALERGTRRMQRRPILERVAQILQPARVRRLRKAIQRALKL
jgi:hypothetical protein